MKINWKVSLHHKQFWVTLIALFPVLAKQSERQKHNKRPLHYWVVKIDKIIISLIL